MLASFNNAPFNQYRFNADSHRLPDGAWKEIFNSDAVIYGGSGLGNDGTSITASGGSMVANMPACGFIVLVLTV